MKYLITKEAYDNLLDKYENLVHKERPEAVENINENKPNGPIEDNSEHLNSLSYLASLDLKINNLKQAINNAVIFNKSMINKSIVGFGSTVTFENVETGNVKSYRLLSIYESDVEKNIISIKSPFGMEMMGKKVGDYFSYNDIEYEIKSIDY